MAELDQARLNESVRIFVAKQLDRGLEEVTLGASLTDDLGADSLDTIELITMIEEAFNVDIDETDLQEAAEKLDSTKRFFGGPGITVGLLANAVFVAKQQRVSTAQA